MTADEIHDELKIKTPIHKWWKREIESLSLSEHEYSLKKIKVYRGWKVECRFSKSAIKKIRDKYSLSCKRVYAEREHGALSAVEQILGVKLLRQYKVKSYRLDGYDKVNNVAYEIDEGHHKTKIKKDADEKRQKDIEFLLGCRFVRIYV